MATIERTAYPRFPKAFSTQELEALYAPLPEELDWIRRSARGERSRLGLLVLFKVFQQLHYFPALDSIPAAVVDYIRATAGIDAASGLAYDTRSSVTLFRHHAAIRDYLGIKPYYGADGSEIAIRAAHSAAAPRWISLSTSSTRRSTSSSHSNSNCPHSRRWTGSLNRFTRRPRRACFAAWRDALRPSRSACSMDCSSANLPTEKPRTTR